MNRFITPDSTLPTNPSIPITEKVEIKKNFMTITGQNSLFMSLLSEYSKKKHRAKKLPTLKMLREEKNRLTKLQTVQRDEFNTRREYERELRTVCSNVNIILRHPHIQETLHETSQEHSYFR